MLNDNPIGENGVLMKKIGKNSESLSTPSQPKFKEDIIVKDVKKLVNVLFTNHPGDTVNFWLGTSRRR